MTPSATTPAVSNAHLTTEHAHRLRRAGASLGALVAAAGFTTFFFDGPINSNFEPEVVMILLPLVGLLAAAGLAWTRSLSAQILARAFCWSALVFGFMLSVLIPGPEAAGPITMVWGSGIALLALGQLGLKKRDRDVSTFTPAAFAGPLVAGLVMAIADLQTLTMWGGIATLEEHDTWTGIALLVGAAIMLVAIIGMFRLKMWGVVMNLVANLSIATFALASSEIPEPIAYCLTATAVLQLLLPAPMIISMITNRRPKERKNLWVLAPLSIATLMALSVACYSWSPINF